MDDRESWTRLHTEAPVTATDSPTDAVTWASGGMVAARARAVDLRRQLARCHTIEAALAVLSLADLPTLREIERGYHTYPAPAGELRERLAISHVLLVCGVMRGAAVLDTQKLTTPQVLGWALDTLNEWLPGHTDWDEAAGGQYRVELVEDHTEQGLVFEVSTLEYHDPRRFRVTVSVTEEADPPG